jgi:hypothetical protein
MMMILRIASPRTGFPRMDRYFAPPSGRESVGIGRVVVRNDEQAGAKASKR